MHELHLHPLVSFTQLSSIDVDLVHFHVELDGLVLGLELPSAVDELSRSRSSELQSAGRDAIGMVYGLRVIDDVQADPAEADLAAVAGNEVASAVLFDVDVAVRTRLGHFGDPLSCAELATAKVVEVSKHPAVDQDVGTLLALKAELMRAIAHDGGLLDDFDLNGFRAGASAAPLDQWVELDEAVGDDLSEAVALFIAGEVREDQVVVDESGAIDASAGDALEGSADRVV